MTAYGGGLWVSELVHLKVTDIHSDRMMIRVDQGKGKKTVIPFYQNACLASYALTGR